MDDNTHILNLPPELIVRIASYLTTPELGPFRASCVQIEKYLFNSFAREFFTKRQFMIEHESLEALEGIANHPGLASSLQEVIIGSQMFYLGNTTQVKELSKNRFKKGLHTRSVLIYTGQAHFMLANIFAKLPNLRVVGLRNYDGTGRRRDGENACWKSWGWSLPDSICLAPPTKLFPLVLAALGTANARPASIEVFLRGHQSLDPGSFCSTGSWGTLPVLNNLTRFMVNICIQRHERASLAHEDLVIQQAPLRKFLTKLTSIEHLRLNFVWYETMAQSLLDWLVESSECSSMHNPTDWTIPAPSFNTLQVLDLGMAKVQQATLVKVLIRFDLQSFSLWKMVLVNETVDGADIWPTFLTRLAKELPEPSRIRDIMIGYPAQDYKENSTQLLRYTSISWICKDTSTDQKGQVKKESIAKYQAQNTAETPQDWLKDLSKLVDIQALHHGILRGNNEIEMSFGEDPDTDEDLDEDLDDDNDDDDSEEDLDEDDSDEELDEDDLENMLYGQLP